jgi:hypothetical protein
MAHGRRTISILGAVAAAVLATAATVQAGGGVGGSGLWVCGPHHAAHLAGAIEERVPTTYDPRMKVAPPAAPQAFYRVDLNGSTTCATNGATPLGYFVPATGEVRVLGQADNAFWVKLAPDVTATLRRAIRKVQPYRAPTTLSSVLVNDNDAARPSSYLRLYTIGTPTRSAPSGIHWLRIVLFGDTSPWTDGRDALLIARRGHNYLKRDGQVVRIAASVAARIRRAQPIPK